MLLGSYRKALVTGGCGFIGSHIVDELLRRGIETYVLDNLSTGSIRNIRNHLNDDEELFHFIQGDISNISHYFSDVSDIDIVFHEAAIASVTKSIIEPQFVFESNVSSSFRVLNFCKESGIKKMVFASSSAVYGDQKGHELSENLFPKPISPYGASKITIEHFLHSYWETYGLETVSLRYFNVYGPRQSNNEYSGVITIFINRLLNNKPLVIYGDGKQIRDFVNIHDVVKANMLAMDSPYAAGEAINIGTGIQTSILNLANTIKSVLGRNNSPTLFSDSRPGDIRMSLANITKSNEILGFNPSMDLNTGLNEYVNSIKIPA